MPESPKPRIAPTSAKPVIPTKSIIRGLMNQPPAPLELHYQKLLPGRNVKLEKFPRLGAYLSCHSALCGPS